jgi:hypothetical protein
MTRPEGGLAIRTFVRWRTPPIVPRLPRMVNAPYHPEEGPLPSRRPFGLRAHREEGPREGIGSARLRRALASPDPSERAEAIALLAGEAAAEPVVITALDDPDPRVRLAAARALARLALPRGIGALIRASSGDLSPAVRKEAVAGLGRIVATRLEGRPPPSTRL